MLILHFLEIFASWFQFPANGKCPFPPPLRTPMTGYLTFSLKRTDFTVRRLQISNCISASPNRLKKQTILRHHFACSYTRFVRKSRQRVTRIWTHRFAIFESTAQNGRLPEHTFRLLRFNLNKILSFQFVHFTQRMALNVEYRLLCAKLRMQV